MTGLNTDRDGDTGGLEEPVPSPLGLSVPTATMGIRKRRPSDPKCRVPLRPNPWRQEVDARLPAARGGK